MSLKYGNFVAKAYCTRKLDFKLDSKLNLQKKDSQDTVSNKIIKMTSIQLRYSKYAELYWIFISSDLRAIYVIFLDKWNITWLWPAMSVQCSDAVRQTSIFICTNHTNVPFQNISSINLHCKEIKVPSLIVERLSGAFHLQPIKFPVGFSSVRRGSTVFWMVDKLTKFNLGAKRNHF